VVDQIVQRAALLLKSDRGEARIDLKPEFLGQVRMHIVTDNQLVSVRILTESPMVRELIEHNLHQLKSDLQQLGLQVERVEVSVSEDPRRDAGRQARAHGGRNGRGHAADEAVTGTAAAELAGRTPAGWISTGRGTINMFV
jgi:flagellar hook-length control protein FliK